MQHFHSPSPQSPPYLNRHSMPLPSSSSWHPSSYLAECRSLVPVGTHSLSTPLIFKPRASHASTSNRGGGGQWKGVSVAGGVRVEEETTPSRRVLFTARRVPRMCPTPPYTSKLAYWWQVERLGKGRS